MPRGQERGQPFSANANYASAQTNTELVAARTGESFFITDLIISNGANAGTVKIVRNTAASADVLGPYYLPINGSIVIKFSEPVAVNAEQNIGVTSITVTTHTVTISGYSAPAS